MRRRTCWLLLALIVAGCMERKKETPLPRQPSLYTRLGGTARLETVANRFLALAASSPELSEPIRQAIRDADHARQKARLVRSLGAALGGPYPGTQTDLSDFFDSLGVEITAPDRAVLLSLLNQALKEAGCRADDRKEAITTIEPGWRGTATR